MRLKPRNETEFRNELREGLMNAFPGLCRFDITHSLSGEPDTAITIKDVTFRAELKYSDKASLSIKTLAEVWGMLRKIQQITILNMAAAGILVYVVVCCRGEEALWYRIDGGRAREIRAGDSRPETCLVLERVSRRLPDGRWTSGLDWGDDMPEKKKPGLLKPGSPLLNPSFIKHLRARRRAERLTDQRRPPYTH